jgi:hypothetical protein
MPVVYRAGADGTERRCVRAAAKLEVIAAVGMTVIAAAAMRAAAGKIRQTETGE